VKVTVETSGSADRAIEILKLLDMMVADCDVDTQSVISSYYKNEFNILLPTSFRELFQEPFLNSFIAIIDYNFLNNEGLKALEALKVARPTLPVIFTASRYTEEIFTRAFSLGAEKCFSKPLELKKIDKSIELFFSYGSTRMGIPTNVLLPRYTRQFLGNRKKKSIPPNILKAKKYIEKNFNKHHSLDKLASIACMSRYHFCRTFKNLTGHSSIEYVNMIRTQEAKRFLRNKWFSISEICFFLGYNSLSQFEKVFKKSVGISPSDYRKKSLQKNL
jgi:AraC-like DNA-binding protein